MQAERSRRGLSGRQIWALKVELAVWPSKSPDRGALCGALAAPPWRLVSGGTVKLCCVRPRQLNGPQNIVGAGSHTPNHTKDWTGSKSENRFTKIRHPTKRSTHSQDDTLHQRTLYFRCCACTQRFSPTLQESNSHLYCKARCRDLQPLPQTTWLGRLQWRLQPRRIADLTACCSCRSCSIYAIAPVPSL